MWPFPKKKAPAVDRPLAEPFEIRLERLERQARTLEMEWTETLDKVTRLMGRVAKRAGVDAAEGAAQDPPQRAPNGGQTAGAGSWVVRHGRAFRGE